MQLKLRPALDALCGGAVFIEPKPLDKHGLGVVWLVFGYNATEEVKEIGTELKSSRNWLLVVILGGIGGAVISDRIKKYINKDEEDDDYE